MDNQKYSEFKFSLTLKLSLIYSSFSLFKLKSKSASQLALLKMLTNMQTIPQPDALPKYLMLKVTRPFSSMASIVGFMIL